MIVDLDPGRHCGSVTVRRIETGTGGVTGTRANARGTEIAPGTVTGSATGSATETGRGIGIGTGIATGATATAIVTGTVILGLRVSKIFVFSRTSLTELYVT